MKLISNRTVPKKFSILDIPNKFVVGAFELDLTWVPFPNCLKNKLSWAQIMANKNGVSFSVSDHTIATEFGQKDLETGQSESSDILLRLQEVAVLHIDVGRIDQVIRNLIVNAVRKYSCLCRTFFIYC